MANITIGGLAGKTAVATDEIEVQATSNGASNKVTLLSAMAITSPTLTTPVLGVATATSINKVTITAPATAATLTLINNTTVTGPAATGTLMTLGNAETVTGAKTFGSAGAVGKLILAGSTSGSSILNAAAIAGSTTMTLPGTTTTLAGLAVAQTWTGAQTFGTADVTITDVNVVLGTTTGTKIGTATGQKLGFWNATPVVQQVLATGGGATVDQVITLLQTLGLCKQS